MGREERVLHAMCICLAGRGDSAVVCSHESQVCTPVPPLDTRMVLGSCVNTAVHSRGERLCCLIYRRIC